MREIIARAIERYSYERKIFAKCNAKAEVYDYYSRARLRCRAKNVFPSKYVPLARANVVILLGELVYQ